jgi:hypothetical protein
MDPPATGILNLEEQLPGAINQVIDRLSLIIQRHMQLEIPTRVDGLDAVAVEQEFGLLLGRSMSLADLGLRLG